MNILITRPLIDSEDLMGKLFSLGHKIIHIPTLKITAIKTESVDINQYDALIFTSANAIRNLKFTSEDKSKLCFCVGSITEKIARQSGYHNTLSAGGTVNALKNLISLLLLHTITPPGIDFNASTRLISKSEFEPIRYLNLQNFTCLKIT